MLILKSKQQISMWTEKHFSRCTTTIELDALSLHFRESDKCNATNATVNMLNIIVYEQSNSHYVYMVCVCVYTHTCMYVYEDWTKSSACKSYLI